MTGMFQSSKTASGSPRLQTSSAFSPSLSLDNLEIETFQNAPRDLPNNTGVVDDKTCFHLGLYSAGPGPIRAYAAAVLSPLM